MARLILPERPQLQLKSRPLKTGTHLRRLLVLVRLYGRKEVVAAIVRASELQTYDAAYVENLLLAERYRRDFGLLPGGGCLHEWSWRTA